MPQAPAAGDARAERRQASLGRAIAQEQPGVDGLRAEQAQRAAGDQEARGQPAGERRRNRDHVAAALRLRRVRRQAASDSPPVRSAQDVRTGRRGAGRWRRVHHAQPGRVPAARRASTGRRKEVEVVA